VTWFAWCCKLCAGCYSLAPPSPPTSTTTAAVPLLIQVSLLGCHIVTPSLYIALYST
jgi:hypothetical protein